MPAHLHTGEYFADIDCMANIIRLSFSGQVLLNLMAQHHVSSIYSLYIS